MRLILTAAALVSLTMGANAQSIIQRDGYVRRDGVYVPPSYQTAPNASRQDNWTTRGNTNPITGQPGYRSPTPQAPNYGYGGSRQRGW
jgi:hypothetical protein